MRRCPKCLRVPSVTITSPTCPSGDGYCNWQEYVPAHRCTLPKHFRDHGPAIEECHEDVNGFLYVSNGEYGNFVAFCPFCGMKAKAEPPAPESV